MVNDRLTISVTEPGGPVKRWAGDEPDGGDIPQGLRFGTAVPGGFKGMSCSLLRDISPRSDEGILRDVKVHGPGSQRVWEGRMASLPRDNHTLRPNAVGYSSHMMDDPSFREIYVDRDLASWQSPDLERLIDLANSNISLADFDWAAGSGFSLAFPNRALPANTAAEIMYRGGDLPLAAMEWLGNYNSVPSGYQLLGRSALTPASSDETFPMALTSPITATPGLAGKVFSTPRPEIGIVAYSAASATTPAAGAMWTLRNIAVFGAHGLTRRARTNDTSGVLISDVVADVIRRACPLLKFTTGPDGTIRTTEFIVGHLAFQDATTADDVVARGNAYHGWEWAVWDDRWFYFQPPDRESTVWSARLGQSADISGEGDQSEDIVNGAVVVFTDTTGEKRIVGPPGTIGAIQTSTDLLDTDPLNPVNLTGTPRKWAKYELTVKTYPEAAIRIGQVLLREQLLARRRGTLTLTGPQTLEGQSGDHPAWAVRAGHAVTIVDRPNEPVRRIIETDYDHTSRKVTCSLDSTPARADAVLERMGVGAVGSYQ